MECVRNRDEGQSIKQALEEEKRNFKGSDEEKRK